MLKLNNRPRKRVRIKIWFEISVLVAIAEFLRLLEIFMIYLFIYLFY